MPSSRFEKRYRLLKPVSLFERKEGIGVPAEHRRESLGGQEKDKR